MKHLLDFSLFINEAKLIYEDSFRNILLKIASSSNKVVSEVATKLLQETDFTSVKFKNNEYAIKVHEGDQVIFNGQPMKLGRLLTSFLPGIEPFRIEQFVQVYKLLANDELSKYTVTMLQGEEILTGYNTNNYGERVGGDMHSSCMNDDFSYLQLYELNKNIQLAISKKDGKIRARSLVWKCTNEEYYYDRIYSINAGDKESLVNYFSKSEIHSIPSDSMSVQLQVIPTLYPYVDTFRYINIGKMTVYNQYNEDCTGVMDCTNGEISGGGMSQSDIINHIENNVQLALYTLLSNNVELSDIARGIEFDTSFYNNNEVNILVNSLTTLYNDEYDMDYLRDYFDVYLGEHEINILDFIDMEPEYMDVQSMINNVVRAEGNGRHKKLEEILNYMVEYALENGLELELMAGMYEAMDDNSLSTGFIEEIFLMRIDLYTLSHNLYNKMSSNECLEEFGENM